MAIKVNSNTVIDNSRNLTANTLTVDGSITTSPTTSNTGGYEVSGSSAIDNAKHGYFVNISAKELITKSGYVSGGDPSGISGTNIIDQFPFASPFTTSTDIGNLSRNSNDAGGAASSTDAYNYGGYYPTYQTTIDKWPLTNPFVTATNIGNLAVARNTMAASYSDSDAYAAGGFSPPRITQIDRFQFSTPWPGTATDIGDITVATSSMDGVESLTDGYSCGGSTAPGAPGVTDTINKFPFSSPFVTATDVGNLVFGRNSLAGISDAVNQQGFVAGGYVPPTSYSDIDKFPFSSPFTTATDAGNLSSAYRAGVGSGSHTHGYVSGRGNAPPYGAINKFSFSSPISSSDIANLSAARWSASGTEG